PATRFEAICSMLFALGGSIASSLRRLFQVLLAIFGAEAEQGRTVGAPVPVRAGRPCSPSAPDRDGARVMLLVKLLIDDWIDDWKKLVDLCGGADAVAGRHSARALVRTQSNPSTL